MLPRRIGDARTAHHACKLVYAGISGHRFDACDGAAIDHELLDAKLMIRKSRDLGEVGHTENLITRRQIPYFQPDCFRCLATDTRINFIKNQCFVCPICCQNRPRPDKLVCRLLLSPGLLPA